MKGFAGNVLKIAGPLAGLGTLVMVVSIMGCPPADNGGDGTPPDPNSGITGKYAGSTRCELCHANIHTTWANTLHANALATLEAAGQGENPTCLPCHTVGFGEEGGFVSRETTLDLSDVGCEACHGPAKDHASNANDESLYPPVTISSELCGRCHTGVHHPNYDDWKTSKHAVVEPDVAEGIVAGQSGRLTNCGQCHSGDMFYRGRLNGETLADNAYEGVPVEDLHAVECAICHDPHARTGNAAAPDTGRDFQLRFPEVASPPPTNTIAATTDPTRFNICGQCHHDRGRTWADTSRGPHKSVQSNVFAGEMPVPDGTEPLVLSRISIHSFATEQCATCHMYRQDFQSNEAPTISGHTFEPNTNACATSGCHPSKNQAEAALATLQTETQTRLSNIATRLGDPATWEFTSEGGPDAAGQALLSDQIKQVRFIYHYILSDGSLGVHNPDYVRSLLLAAEVLLMQLGL
jgi:hypothetical protein